MNRGEEQGTASSFDAAKRKFKEGAVLLYGGEGENRKQAVELQTTQNHGTEELRKPGHSFRALRSVNIVGN